MTVHTRAAGTLLQATGPPQGDLRSRAETPSAVTRGGFSNCVRVGEAEQMSGPPPKDAANRRRRNAPARGEWQTAPGIGWQHGETPPPPTGLRKSSRDAWETWMGAWFASFWTPGDLPSLRVLIRLYDQVERGHLERAGDVRLWQSTYGITPAGQLARRWQRPHLSAVHREGAVRS